MGLIGFVNVLIVAILKALMAIICEMEILVLVDVLNQPEKFL